MTFLFNTVATLEFPDAITIAHDVARVDQDAIAEYFGLSLRLGVADHDDHHFEAFEELLHRVHLVGHDVGLDPGVVDLHGAAAQVLLLRLEHLKRRALAHVVHVLLVSEAVDAHLGGVGYTVLSHRLVSAMEHVLGHGGVGLKRQPHEARGFGVVAHKEPGVDRDAMAAHARAGLQDVDPRVLVGDADDLVHVHAPHAAYLGELVGEGDVDGAEGVLHDLGHLGGADVGEGYLALAEGGVERCHALAHLGAVGSDGAVILQQLAHHAARDDALRRVHERDVLPACLLEKRTHVAVDGARGDRGLHDEHGTLRRHLEHRLAGSHDVGGVYLLVHLVVRRWYGDDIGIANLVLGRELDTCLDRLIEEFVEVLFFERGMPGIESCH